MNNLPIEQELFHQVSVKHIQEWCKFLPADVKQLINIHGVYLCGGAVVNTLLGLSIKDYDIFFTSQGAMNKADFIFDRNIKTTSKYALTVGDIQLITKIYKNLDDIFDNFDMHVVQVAVSKDGIHFSDKAIHNLYHKVVTINNISNPLKSMQRLIKYTNSNFGTEAAYKYISDEFQKFNPKLLAELTSTYL